MNVITLDIETYYDKVYSLSKLTTEAYVRDPLFEIILLSLKVGNDPPLWFSGPHDAVRDWLGQFELHKHAVCAHNTAFDGFILNHHFGIRPKFLLDTMSMARPLHANTIGVSLKALSDHYTVGVKGDEVQNVIGMRRADFSKDGLLQYAKYCMTDVQLTYMLLNILRKEFPMGELKVIDAMLRMFTEPVLQLSEEVLHRHGEEVKAKRLEVLEQVGGTEALSMLRSNPKFAEALKSLGVEPPLKISKTTGKPTFAFAKTDPEFKALLEHDDPKVQTLASARLGTKSSIEETRTKSFLEIAARGPLPVPIMYYGGHTGRGSGWDGINLQNLPRGGALRQAIVAPEGHVLVACDSSQIEARVVAWLAGQTDLVEDFRNKADIYSKFASLVYGREINRKKKAIHPETGEEYEPEFMEGFVGKTCLAEGSEVLTPKGWVRIEQLQLSDLVWDGHEWVSHRGVVCNGWKQTITLSGLSLTPDHLVWSGTEWLEARSLAQDKNALYRALAYAAENLPSQGILPVFGRGCPQSLYNAPAAGLSTPLTLRASSLLGALGVLSAQLKQLVRRDTGSTLRLCQTTDTELDYSTDWRQRSRDVMCLPVSTSATMVAEVYAYTLTDALTEQNFYGIYRLSQVGMIHRWRWTGQTTTATMSQATSDLFRGLKTQLTNEKSETWKQRSRVYDVLSAGPRSRFTVRTADGSLIVHNCVLGLGFGMGGDKLHWQLKSAKTPVIIPVEECHRIVMLYRQQFSQIRRLWYRANDAIVAMSKGEEFSLDQRGIVVTGDKKILLPNGMSIRYPYLTKNPAGLDFAYVKDRKQVALWSAMKLSGDWDFSKLTRIFGAKVIENVVQALARIIVFDQMLTIRKSYKVVLNAHDENVVCVPESKADSAMQLMLEVMSQPPEWAPDLPISCEAKIGRTYGEAK